MKPPVATAEHDGDRVHLDGVADDERLQHVPLELLHQDHDAQHDQGRDRAEVDEGDEHREHTGRDGADDRDERAEEHRDRDRDDEREAAGRTARG